MNRAELQVRFPVGCRVTVDPTVNAGCTVFLGEVVGHSYRLPSVRVIPDGLRTISNWSWQFLTKVNS